MSVYGYVDRRKRKDHLAIQLLLQKQRDQLHKQENIWRQQLKEKHYENLQIDNEKY
jgi:hypothetical protein